MVRKLVIAALGVVLIAAGVYAASPYRAAWQIHRAVREADVDTLRLRVDWAAVRQSLKRSSGETRSALSELAEAGASAPEPKPSRGLWEKLKARVTPYFTDALIDRYITAEGAPKLHQWRQTWRQTVRPRLGLSDPQTPLAGTFLGGTSTDRWLALWKRVERASFEGPGRVVLVVRDRLVETRQWRAVMRLEDWTWRLTEVEVLTAPVKTAATAR